MDPNTNTNDNSNKNYKEPVLEMHSEFIKRNWKVNKNERDILIYGKDEYPCDDFTIKTTANSILVSVPITTTNYVYTAPFLDCTKACQYAVMHLKNVEEYYKNKKLKD
jgi:hypothetical protein